MKKLLIALLGINALLIALLTAQAAQAKVKTYDAVKLAQYERCLDFTIAEGIDALRFGGNVSVFMPQIIQSCSFLKP
jgi:hypothetical protein